MPENDTYECDCIDCGKILGYVNSRGVEGLKNGVNHLYRNIPNSEEKKKLEKRLELGHLVRVEKKSPCKYCLTIGGAFFCDNPEMSRLYTEHPEKIREHNQAVDLKLNEPLKPIIGRNPRIKLPS